MGKLNIGDFVFTPEGNMNELVSVRKTNDSFTYELDNGDTFCQEEVDDGSFKLANDCELGVIRNLEIKERVERTIAFWLYKKGYKNPVAMSSKFNSIDNFKSPYCIKTSDYYECRKEFEIILEDYFKIFAS